MSDIGKISSSGHISKILKDKDLISDIKQIISKTEPSSAHKVSISEVSKILSKLSASTSKIDSQRIEEAKNLIQSEKYVNSHKMKQAIDNFLVEIFGS